MTCFGSALLTILTCLWGLWLWVTNDTTLTPLSTALLCISGVSGIICAFRGHYGSDT